MPGSAKAAFKEWVERRGWFVRRAAGLPAGTHLRLDLARLGLDRARIVFDVGAHRGESVRVFEPCFPAAHIFAFEPVRANFEALCACARPSRVTCLHTALGDRTEDATIVLQGDSQTHSLNRRARADQGGSTETVRVTTLDAVCAERRIERIDFLKIDTEGYELAVLAGGSEQLRRAAVGAILVEASLDPQDTVHTPLSRLAEWLGPYGYRLAAIYDQVLWDAPTRLAYFNALFVGGAPAPSSNARAPAVIPSPAAGA